MAKVSRSPIIRAADLPSALGQISNYNREITGALQGQLTLTDNIAMELVEATVTAPEPTWIYVGDTANGGPAFGANVGPFTLNYTFQTPRYRMTQDGFVKVEGSLYTTGAMAASSTIWTFPVGWRPTRHHFFATTTVGGTYLQLRIFNDGNFLLDSPGIAAGTLFFIPPILFEASSVAADPNPVAPGYEAAGPLVATGGKLVPKSPKNNATTGQALPVGFPFKLNPKRIKSPTTVTLLRCQDLSPEAARYVTHASIPDWEYSTTDGLTVKYVGGLHPGRVYKLQFLLMQ